MVSRREVAERAGVSEATVSRVLNGVGPMKEETRRKVLEAAAELGYQPSAIARSFARGKSGNLGVVLPSVPKVHLFSTYYFSEILSGIGEAVQRMGYGLLLLFRSPEEEMDYISHYRTQKVDALVILGASDLPHEREALRKLDREGLPFCIVNQHYPEERFYEVDADHEEGSYQAVRHLLSLGAERIGFINGGAHYSNSRDRLEGYRRALREAGRTPDPALMAEGNYSRRSGLSAAERLRDRLGQLDAVFAANDRMAIGFMQGIRSFGVVPGRDIRVAGYDDSDGASLTDPPLTTVHVPFYEMGRRAAERVLELAEKGPPNDEAGGHEREVLATRLVVRQSSGT
ncbi:LacI family DNA-binding transcriptional regulator [Gorillibacterium sp. sgz5001074]|uniref:LacI family DNA-binding transcriptional regulator n=1 Tax=Gorillibacterium sp. sgz5001074 TaxID=3446695 RepID=UPI003F66986F